MPVWEAEAMYSPVDLFIQQIVFQCEAHTRCFPRYFQSGIKYCLPTIVYSSSCTSQAYMPDSEGGSGCAGLL